jgi:predicted dinucleotide-binding enzyme
MSTDVAIIGTGNVGAALARTFARHGQSAVIANTRGPDSFRDLAHEVAPWVRATTLEDALDADVLILAIPFLATETLGARKSSWRGRIVVDATNAFLVPDSEAILAGRLSTEVVAGLFPDASVVKAFNQLPANVLERQIPTEHGKKVVFVSSNDASASAAIARLAADIGFAPVELGRIDEGGRLIQARNALVLRLFVEQPMF